jgi:exopolysaccharide biosynthesis polyprenyl glycosylphosphotransferase
MHASTPGEKFLRQLTPPKVRPVNISNALQWRVFISVLTATDLTIIFAAFTLAYWLRFELALPIFDLEITPPKLLYSVLNSILTIAWVFLFALNGLYNRNNLLGGTQEYDRILRATTMGMMLMIIAGFLQPELYFARGWLLLSWILAFVGVLSARFALRRVVYALRRQGYFLSPTLIIGTNEEARLLAQQLGAWQTSGLHVYGFVSDDHLPGARIDNHLTTLGTLSNLDALIQQHGVEELVVASSAVSSETMIDIFTRYGRIDGLNLRLSSGLYEVITTGLEVKEIGSVSLVGVNKLRLTEVNWTLKSILDYAITLPGVLAILPVMGFIALAIRLDSPGPALHKRRVMGLNGREFDAYKFRTMYVNGDTLLRTRPELQAELALNHKLKNDPRITRLGHILRKTSLDELPQLFNVLKRQMSLIGPRMIAPEEMEKYGHWGMNLLTVPPGISGLWQVSGRSDVSYDERVRLDMYYIRNWTIWLDIQILFQTIPAVLQKRGAY